MILKVRAWKALIMMKNKIKIIVIIVVECIRRITLKQIHPHCGICEGKWSDQPIRLQPRLENYRVLRLNNAGAYAYGGL